jgi:CelD/BcsL family acetyltransferase involved in cellulose biosynthesis
VSIVRTLQDLCSLEAAWEALWKLDSSATVFQSPHWLVPWSRRFSQGELLTGAAWDATGALTGLAPMYLLRQANEDSARLLPLGIGTTDYLDFVTIGSGDGTQVNALLLALSQGQHEWGTLDVPQLRAHSHLLRADTPGAFPFETTTSEPCSALELPASTERLHQTLPAKMVHNLKYYERRARRAGSLSYSLADSRSLEEHADALLELHAERWVSRGGEGVLSSKPVQDWHRETIERLERAGLLRMHGLRLNGRLVAVNYCLADPHDHGGAMYYYIGGFDPELSSLSPGTLLIGHAIKEAVRAGAPRFDFLRGREAYKALWGARDVPTYRCHLRRGSTEAVHVQERAAA